MDEVTAIMEFAKQTRGKTPQPEGAEVVKLHGEGLFDDPYVSLYVIACLLAMVRGKKLE